MEIKNKKQKKQNKVCFKKRGCFAPSKGLKTPIHHLSISGQRWMHIYKETRSSLCFCAFTWVELKHETLVFSAPNYRACAWVYVCMCKR